MRIILLIVFFCFFCFNGFCFPNDSVKTNVKSFMIKTNPALLLPEGINFLIEYKKGNFGIETGGGYIGDGFTVRTGTKFYFREIKEHNRFTSQLYLEPLIFYRYREYGAAIYGNIDPYGLPWDWAERRPEFKATEIKNVFAFELLMGKVFLFKNFLLDLYWGTGIRYKIRIVCIECRYNDPLGSDECIPLSEIEKGTYSKGFTPTIHFGLKLGYEF